MVALSALVSGLDAELMRLGYKYSTMVWYRGYWRCLQKYFAGRGVEEFSLDLAMAWVDQAYGFFAKEQAGTLKPADVYLFRVAQMLGDFAVHGAVLRRYSRTVDKLIPGQADVVARLREWLQAGAILSIPAQAWTPAYDADGEVRDGAWAAELTGMLNLSSWPEGMRLICAPGRTPACAATRCRPASLRVLAAVEGERLRSGCVVAGGRGFRGGCGCGQVACDDTVSVSDMGRPSP
jgi:hypothetical protein